MKEFSAHVMTVFANNNTDYDAMNNLMQDVALGREIYDAESDRIITKAEANAKILDFSRQILGVGEHPTRKELDRAFEDHGKEWFRIIEDTIDMTVTVGLKDNEWFNDLVDSRSIAYGDRQDFEVVDNDVILAVAKGGTSHHDHAIQRLAPGEVITIPTALYVVKVGADINKYILGQIDWTRLVDAISKAYTAQIQEDVYAEILTVAAGLPSQFVGTGTLGSTTKAAFDAIIENVQAANDGAEVMIMGTKSAVSKISALADVNWGAAAQKDSMMNTGNIGIYEGTRLLVMPNRFADKTMTSKVFDSTKLFIMPIIGDAGKFVKFIDEGDTRILEKMDRGDYVSDLQTYEVQRHMGVGSVLGRYFGQWTI